MATGILAYEMTSEEDQLLSEVVDGWLERHPILTRLIIAQVSLHLLNLLPPYLDILARTPSLKRLVSIRGSNPHVRHRNPKGHRRNVGPIPALHTNGPDARRTEGSMFRSQVV